MTRGRGCGCPEADRAWEIGRKTGELLHVRYRGKQICGHDGGSLQNGRQYQVGRELVMIFIRLCVAAGGNIMFSV